GRQDRAGLGEAGLLAELNELEHIAAGSAAKALEDLLGGHDEERRRLLLMERTQAAQVLPRASEFDVIADHVGDIERLLDASCQCFVEHGTPTEWAQRNVRPPISTALSVKRIRSRSPTTVRHLARSRLVLAVVSPATIHPNLARTNCRIRTVAAELLRLPGLTSFEN